MSYELSAKVKGNLKQEQGNGSNLSPSAINVIKNADVGGRIYIDLKVKGPDGIMYPSSCSIKVLR
jgi:hypothetical protein